MSSWSGNVRLWRRKLRHSHLTFILFYYSLAHSLAMHQDDPSQPSQALDIEPEGPKPIRKLTEDVVNRIAAAEVWIVCVISPLTSDYP